MVRRAEYAVTRSIRKGQAEGTVNRQGVGSSGTWGPGQERRSPDSTTTRVYDLLPTGSDRAHHAALAEADEHEFDAALDDARAEGNLSRANVARKVAERTGKQRATRRAPLTDFAYDAGIDLLKVAERLQRVVEDDRFKDNRTAIAERAAGQVGARPGIKSADSFGMISPAEAPLDRVPVEGCVYGVSTSARQDLKAAHPALP